MSKIFYGIMLAAFAGVFALTATGAMADDTPSNAFYLKNTSNVTLHFQYYCDGKPSESTTEALDGQDSSWYWDTSGCTDYTIVKSTNDNGETKSFTYTVSAGHKYEIYWDTNERAWDIQEQ